MAKNVMIVLIQRTEVMMHNIGILSHDKLHNLPEQLIVAYIFAGNSVIVIRNSESHKCFEFKIKGQQQIVGEAFKERIYWVSTRYRSANGTYKYRFIGTLSKSQGFRFSPRGHAKQDDACVIAAQYYFLRVLRLSDLQLSDKIKTYHIGLCGHCGHELPDNRLEILYDKTCSIKLGIELEEPTQTTLFDNRTLSPKTQAILPRIRKAITLFRSWAR